MGFNNNVLWLSRSVENCVTSNYQIMWIYKTMRYDNRLDIQFRFDYVTGVVEMRVDDNVAEANGFYNLEHLKTEIAKSMPMLEVPEWLRIDNCGSPALATLNLN